jgi:hypothetical protein
MTASVKRLQGGRNPNGAELRLFNEQAASLATAIFSMGETTRPNADIPRTAQVISVLRRRRRSLKPLEQNKTQNQNPSSEGEKQTHGH